MAHFLLIDDDPDFAAALEVQLRDAGHSLAYAAGSQEALSLLIKNTQDQPFDAVLVDMFMPNVDGIETIAALRKADVTLPVIAISGCGTTRHGNVLEWATSLGADAAIDKPFVTDRLIMLVESIPERAAAWPGARP